MFYSMFAQRITSSACILHVLPYLLCPLFLFSKLSDGVQHGALLALGKVHPGHHLLATIGQEELDGQVLEISLQAAVLAGDLGQRDKTHPWPLRIWMDDLALPAAAFGWSLSNMSHQIVNFFEKDNKWWIFL